MKTKIKYHLLFIISLLTLSAHAQRILVIIDMQEPFATRGGQHQQRENPKVLETIIQRQKHMIETAKQHGVPILIVEYERFGSTNAELMKEIGDYDKAATVIKNTDGLFSQHNTHKPKAMEFLKKHNAKELILMGANGGACVESTLRGALEEKFKVWAYADGIADFNYSDFVFPYVYRTRGYDYERMRTSGMDEVEKPVDAFHVLGEKHLYEADYPIDKDQDAAVR